MKVTAQNVDEYRSPEHDIEPLLYHRWSPRAMDGRPVDEADLMRLFEASRWAPSSYNDQPWTFFWARRDTAHWEPFFGWLVEGNQAWAQTAGALVAVTTRVHFAHNGKPNSCHTFDAGAAWQNLALQGTAMGLVTHAMAGFDRAAAREGLGLGDDREIHCMVAIGYPASLDDLPEDVRGREKPNGRKTVAEIAHEGPLG